MPITITLPTPGTKIGPGFVFDLASDFIGPLPSGTFWSVTASSDSEGANAVWTETFPTDAPFGTYQVANPGISNSWSYTAEVADGDTVHVITQLITPTSGVVDSGATTKTWKPTEQLWAEVRNVIPASGGGLTTDQATQLADDHAAINPPLIAHDGTAITGGVGDVIVRPALKFIGIDTTVYTLTGSGTLDVPNIAGVQTAWGLILDVTADPPGVGFKPGYVDSYMPRVGQFLLLWPARNTEEAMVIEELRLHLAHFTWLWSFANAAAIAYYIEPMFTVQARFASAFFP